MTQKIIIFQAIIIATVSRIISKIVKHVSFKHAKKVTLHFVTPKNVNHASNGKIAKFVLEHTQTFALNA